ncbi:MAG: glycosyltransferase [Oceanospirillales bacterium]|nr:glycosyltransferase [Oceanospirillales bacterium]
MTDLPLVSVIIPVYNGAEYLGESLGSILAQTYPNIEIIIIDDSSQDNSVALIESMSANITVIVNPNNIGVSASRNKGMHAANGKYIAFMDADDVSVPHRIESQVDFLEKNSEYGLISSTYETFEELLQTGRKSLKKLPSDPDFIAARLLFQCVICCPASMLRTDLILKHDLYFNESLSVCEDWDLWYRISQVTRVSNIEDVLLYYRKHGSNLSKNRTLMYQNKIKIIQNSLLDHGVDTRDLFDEELHLKGVAEFSAFVKSIERFSDLQRTEKKFSEKEILAASAYVLYEIYKTNVKILGYCIYDVLRRSWLYQYMDISLKKRVINFLRCKLSRLKI